MRRQTHLSVPSDWQKVLTEHLGEQIEQEMRAYRRSRLIRYVLFPVALAAVAALLFALFHY